LKDLNGFLAHIQTLLPYVQIQELQI